MASSLRSAKRRSEFLVVTLSSQRAWSLLRPSTSCSLAARDKKKTVWLLPAWLSIAVVCLTSCGSIDSYRITKGGENQVCEDVRKAIRSIPPPRPASPGICRWHAQIDSLSTDSVQSPKWRPFTPSEELVRDMRLVSYSYFKHADKNTLADIWKSEFQSQWREAMRKGEYMYEQSSFDIDDDGRTERVVREVHVGCSDELLWPATPRMYVLTDQGIDDRYGPSGTNVSSAIIVRNRTFAVVVDSVPDPSPKNAAGQYQPPRLEVNLYWPRPPSQLVPFMLNGPICSFEPNR